MGQKRIKFVCWSVPRQFATVTCNTFRVAPCSRKLIMWRHVCAGCYRKKATCIDRKKLLNKHFFNLTNKSHEVANTSNLKFNQRANTKHRVCHLRRSSRKSLSFQEAQSDTNNQATRLRQTKNLSVCGAKLYSICAYYFDINKLFVRQHTSLVLQKGGRLKKGSLFLQTKVYSFFKSCKSDIIGQLHVKYEKRSCNKHLKRIIRTLSGHISVCQNKSKHFFAKLDTVKAPIATAQTVVINIRFKRALLTQSMQLTRKRTYISSSLSQTRQKHKLSLVLEQQDINMKGTQDFFFAREQIFR